jgi:predicted transcriptional regulator of viral defense system
MSVALLSAAELHGAAHQAPQVFQVMVDRHVRDRGVGRARLRFFASTHVAQGTPTDPRAGDPRRGPLDRAWNVRVNVQVDPDL